MSEVNLSEGRPRRRPGFRGFLVVLGALLIVGGLLVAVLMGWVMPKQYESTAVIQVLGGFETEEVQEKPSVELMAVEARRVVGVPTFDRVRERLQLESRWNADVDEVTEMLRRMVTAEVREGTDLIEITARHRNAMDARDVAIGLAEEYRDLRKEEEIRKAQAVLEALDAELKAQEKKVEEKRKMLDELLEDTGLDGKDGPGPSADLRAIRKSEELDLLELQAEGRLLDEIVRKLGVLRGEELFRYAAALELPQNTASILWEEYERLLGESEELRESGFGDAHPQVVGKELQLSLLKDDLERAIKRMRKVTVDQGRFLELRRDSLVQAQDRKESGMRALQIASNPYLKAKEAYWDELALLQSLKARHASLRIGSEMRVLAVRGDGGAR